MIDQAMKSQVKFWIDGVRHRLRRPLRTIRGPHRAAVPAFRPMTFAARAEYVDYHAQRADEFEQRRRFMRDLGMNSGRVVTSGYCIACGRPRKFSTEPPRPGPEGPAAPNWREGVICQGCGLGGRMRASIHLLLHELEPDPHCRIYLTEQITALYRWAKLRFPDAVGSEYLRDGTRRGHTNRYGIRHEDLTALSFANESFDALISLEVMEHIPDFRKALAECARVLVPGGKMVLSVPFHQGPEHLERARVGHDGTIEHLLPAEYHGDPLDLHGCLCFHHFGWDLLDLLKAAGFRQATAQSIWSTELGYLEGGGDIVQFVAVK